VTRVGSLWPRRDPLLCRWDLDKTYLRSDFDTLRQLWRAAWERGEDKVEVPGVPAVMKALKAAAERRRRGCEIYFVSASPPQIGKAIRDKLALDGVPYDGIVFKDQLRHIRRGKFRNLREHVGFKLGELFRGRAGAPPATEELLFGDDWESDPLTYSAYADVVAGGLSVAELTRVLGRIGVDARAVPGVLEKARRVERAPRAVRRIFINLARRTPPGRLRVFGPRLVPTYNYFQTAVVLAADGYIDANGVADVARALGERADFAPVSFDNSLADLVRRRVITARQARRLAGSLRPMGLLPAIPRRESVAARWRRWRRLRRTDPGREQPPVLDYEDVFERFPHLARGIAERE
jgi:hypothetical protein